MSDDRVRFTRHAVVLPAGFPDVLLEFIECLRAFMARHPSADHPGPDDVACCEAWAGQGRTEFTTAEAARIAALIGAVDGAERLLHLGLRPRAARLIDSVDVQLIAALEAIAHLSRTVHARNRVH